MNRSTVLGAHEDCCWSEAQAWAIAGYLRAYEETNDEKYLVIGRTLLSYIGRTSEGLDMLKSTSLLHSRSGEESLSSRRS